MVKRFEQVVNTYNDQLYTFISEIVSYNLFLYFYHVSTYTVKYTTYASDSRNKQQTLYV